MNSFHKEYLWYKEITVKTSLGKVFGLFSILLLEKHIAIESPIAVSYIHLDSDGMAAGT